MTGYDDPHEVELTMELEGDGASVRGRALELMVRRNVRPEVTSTTGSTSRVRLVGTRRALRSYLDEVYDPERYGSYDVRPVP